MTDLDDLRDELERLGRRPVPAPRAEFVDDLLARIVGDDATGEVPAPLPLRPAARRRFAQPRAVALVSVAAALLLAVGVVGMLVRDVGTTGDIAAELSSAASDVPLTTAPATTTVVLEELALRNDTEAGGDVIRLSWDAYSDPDAEVTYVVRRTAGSRSTETVVSGTTYEEPVPTEVVDLTFSIEVRAADGTVVARGNSLVTIKVTSSN